MLTREHSVIPVRRSDSDTDLQTDTEKKNVDELRPYIGSDDKLYDAVRTLMKRTRK